MTDSRRRPGTVLRPPAPLIPRCSNLPVFSHRERVPSQCPRPSRATHSQRRQKDFEQEGAEAAETGPNALSLLPLLPPVRRLSDCVPVQEMVSGPSWWTGFYPQISLFFPIKNVSRPGPGASSHALASRLQPVFGRLMAALERDTIRTGPEVRPVPVFHPLPFRWVRANLMPVRCLLRSPAPRLQ